MGDTLITEEAAVLPEEGVGGEAWGTQASN